jgi:hypothetical protein
MFGRLDGPRSNVRAVWDVAALRKRSDVAVANVDGGTARASGLSVQKLTVPKSILKPFNLQYKDFIKSAIALHSSGAEAFKSVRHSPEQYRYTKMVDRRCRVYHEVAFGFVHVREYARTVGDNPSVSSGPPLAYVSSNYTSHSILSNLVSHIFDSSRLDWAFDPNERQYTVNEYEALHRAVPSRSEQELVIPRVIREEILLLEWHVSRKAVAAAVRDVIRTKNQRRQTIHSVQSGWGKVDLKLRSVLGPRLSMNTTDDSSMVLTRTLLRQHEIAAAQLQAAVGEDYAVSYDEALLDGKLNPTSDDFDYVQYYTHPPTTTTTNARMYRYSAPSSHLRLCEQNRPKLDIQNDTYLTLLSEKLWTSAAPSRCRRSLAGDCMLPTTSVDVKVKSGSPQYRYYPKVNSLLDSTVQAMVPREIHVYCIASGQDDPYGSCDFADHNDDDDDDVSAITNDNSQ